MSPNSFLILAISYLVFAVGKVCLSDEPKPNVILIMTDDQGYGELSSHGHAILKTPNLDRFRDESVRLTDFHVSSKCSPTRGALMTGRHCRHVGVREADNGRNIIGREFSTIADIFSENGYKTGIFGKWHLGGHYPFRLQESPLERYSKADEQGEVVDTL